MSEFTWKPDTGGFDIDENDRVMEARFGDGYSQRVPDGINHLQTKFSLTFSRPDEEIDEIVTFLRSKSGGQTFDYTPNPMYGTIKVWCKGWKRSNSNFGFDRLNCTFEKLDE